MIFIAVLEILQYFELINDDDEEEEEEKPKNVWLQLSFVNEDFFELLNDDDGILEKRKKTTKGKHAPTSTWCFPGNVHMYG